MKIESLKRDIAGMKGAPATAAARLGAKTLMAALNAELAQKRAQLANPTWMANQYQTKAKNLVQRSGEIAPFDLQSASLLTQQASLALNQGDKFLAQAKMQAAAKNSGSGAQPVQDFAVRVVNGEIVETRKLTLDKEAHLNQGILPEGVDPRLKQKDGWQWKAQFDATTKGDGGGKGKDIHFDAVKALNVAVLGYSSEFAATPEQAALLNFSRRMLAREQEALEAEHKRKLTEAEAGNLISWVFKHHRDKHNQFYRESRGINPRFKSPEDTKKTGELPGLKQIDRLIKQKKISKKTAEAIKQGWHDNGLEIFGYVVRDNFRTQARYIDTKRSKLDWKQ